MMSDNTCFTKPWQLYVFPENGEFDYRAYTFCALEELHIALRRRDVFIAPSWRYSDPRAGLLANKEWESTKPIICRTLDLSDDPQPVLVALAEELDQTYKSVLARLPDNPAIRFETIKGKSEFILTPLDRLEESASLKALRHSVMMRLPRIDLPEILLEIAARTKFTDAFTHVTERSARAEVKDGTANVQKDRIQAYANDTGVLLRASIKNLVLIGML